MLCANNKTKIYNIRDTNRNTEHTCSPLSIVTKLSTPNMQKKNRVNSNPPPNFPTPPFLFPSKFCVYLILLCYLPAPSRFLFLHFPRPPPHFFALFALSSFFHFLAFVIFLTHFFVNFVSFFSPLSTFCPFVPPASPPTFSSVFRLLSFTEVWWPEDLTVFGLMKSEETGGTQLTRYTNTHTHTRTHTEIIHDNFTQETTAMYRGAPRAFGNRCSGKTCRDDVMCNIAVFLHRRLASVTFEVSGTSPDPDIVTLEVSGTSPTSLWGLTPHPPSKPCGGEDTDPKPELMDRVWITVGPPPPFHMLNAQKYVSQVNKALLHRGHKLQNISTWVPVWICPKSPLAIPHPTGAPPPIETALGGGEQTGGHPFKTCQNICTGKN